MRDRGPGKPQIELAPTRAHRAAEVSAGEHQRRAAVALKFDRGDGQSEEVLVADRVAVGVKCRGAAPVGKISEGRRAPEQRELAVMGAGIERQAQWCRRGREQRQLGVRNHVVERRGRHPHAAVAQEWQQPLLLVSEARNEQRLIDRGMACQAIVLMHHKAG